MAFKSRLAQLVADFVKQAPCATRLSNTWAEAIDLMSNAPESMAAIALPHDPAEIERVFIRSVAAVHATEASESPAKKCAAILRLMAQSAWWVMVLREPADPAGPKAEGIGS